jgi:BolA protein
MNNETRIKWMTEQFETTLQPTVLSIRDDSHKHIGHEGSKNGAGHFTVEIWSPHFVQKSLIECHRLVYGAVEEAIPNEVHALKIIIAHSN